MRSYKPIERVEFIVVHCAATPPDMDIGKAEIRKWHLQRGFADIGYHYVIRRDGRIEFGRPTDQPGAHAVGYNRESLGICLVGGLKKGTTKAENNFTPKQFSVLRTLLEQLKRAHPHAEILGHRDLPGVSKACPSFDVREWLRGASASAVADHHVVAKGETLSAIARLHGVSIAALASRNSITDVNSIRVGQRLEIPRS